MPVYEVGEVGPICYIASAYCEGPNLATWLQHPRPRPTPKQAAWIVAALADAMHYAHAQGVLHRDLKPSNVLLEPQPAGTAANELEKFAAAIHAQDYRLRTGEDQRYIGR